MESPELITQFVGALQDEDKSRLRQVLELPESANDATIAKGLVPFATAALAEYVDQFTGRQLPSRMKDQEQLRLLHITKQAFKGQLPDPDKVADLFQKSSSEARSLLRNTATRYRYELARDMDEAAWSVLVGHSRPAGREQWNVEIRDLALVEYMSEAVRRGPGNPLGIQKSKDEMHVYTFDKGTLNALLASLHRSYEQYQAALSQTKAA